MSWLSPTCGRPWPTCSVRRKGFYQLMMQLPQERLAIAVGAVASAELAVDLAVAYTKERTAFGKPISAFQNTRFTLAEVSTDVMAARTFLDHCVALHVDGKLDAATASRAKYWTTDVQCEVIDSDDVTLGLPP